MRTHKRASLCLSTLAGLSLAAACSSDPGLIDCPAFIDHRISCGLSPGGDLRATNIKICNNWERTYKADVVEALDECTQAECSDVQTCMAAANQLCQADVSQAVVRLCERVSECQWEELTTMELCVEELNANQGLYACLRPEILEDYIQCVRNISCGPESEDEWYVCGFEHIQPG